MPRSFQPTAFFKTKKITQTTLCTQNRPLCREEGETLYTALTTTEHSATPVRVFALGKGAEYFSGKTVDNTDIAKFIINAIEGK